MSGSRLPGDSDTNDRHKQTFRVDARLKDDELGHRAREYINDHGLTKTELVRKALDDFLPTADQPYVVPQDPKLSKAYLSLACEEKRIISIEEAKDELSETFPSTGKEVIEDGILRPLGDTPFLAVQWGRLAVHPLTRKEEVDD